MIAAALESLELWKMIGTAVNEQRGVWLVARCHVAVGHAEPAVQFALRTLELTEAHRDLLEDFDHAFAEEIAARAFALSKNLARAAQHARRAIDLGHVIKVADDRRTFFEQFEAEPWFGLAVGHR